MASLSAFPDISSNNVSVCEKYGKLCTLPVNEVNIGEMLSDLQDYPVINALHSTSSFSKVDRSSVVVASFNESAYKRLARIYVEEGFSNALTEAAYPTNNAPIPRLLQKLAQSLINLNYLGKRIQHTLLPHTRLTGASSFVQYSETRNWSNSHIRCVRWHPDCFKIAVATLDDSVRIYEMEGHHCAPILRSGFQKGITSMAWRPFSASELAVGCHNGVLIWTVDPNSNMSRPLSQAQHLKFQNNYPVSSIEWSPNGCLLATCSLNSPDVLIWDVDRDLSTPLKRSGFSNSLLRWSPNGVNLFSSTIGNIFRVWSTEKWTPEKWQLPSGSIQSAVWSSCGSILLFVTTNEPYLYSLGFIEGQLFTNHVIPKEALPVADLSKTLNSSSIQVGGCPQAISWCPKNRNLAVMFKETSAIAIFTTNISYHTLYITPSSFLNGISIEYPVSISFQPDHRQQLFKYDAILTIGWSSGRVQFFPFI